MIQPQYAQPIMQYPVQYPQPVTGQGASAVSINIHNPQAFGAPTQPVMQNPYSAPYYQYPQAQVYSPMPQQMYPQPYMPQQMPAEAYPAAQQPVMPEPVIASQPVAQAPVSQEPIAPGAQPAAQAPAAPEAAPQASAPKQMVDVAAVNQALNSQNLEEQADAITQVAQLSQSTPEVALQLVDNTVMKGLAAIIGKDTSQLPGPTPEQIAIAEKAQKGQQLNPQEQQLAQQSSPRELAERNKVFSMFTLAMLQKLQRDEIDNYNLSADPASVVPAIKLQDLTGHNEIINTLNTTQIPAVKAAAIQALAYSARPEDAQVIQQALAGVTNELNTAQGKANPDVLSAYQEAMSKIGAAPQVQLVQQQQPAAQKAA